MKRAGFTMIELIFVIVILGVLAAVAVPKLVGTKEQAEAGKCKAFYGTLTRTVAPAMYAEYQLDDLAIADAFNTTKLAAQTDVPANSACGTAAEIVACMTNGTDFTVTIGTKTYDVACTGASATSSPTFAWSVQ